ncbi:MAG: hypothetical protein ACK4SX_15535 [Alcanivoracaceae bacterium]
MEVIHALPAIPLLLPQKRRPPLSMGSQNVMLTPLRSFFRWLTRENYPLYNPARLEGKAALLSSLAAENESDKP